MTDIKDMTKRIKMKGYELGFAKVGITTADDFDEYEQELYCRPGYLPWLDTPSGFHTAKVARPRSYYPEGKSIVFAIYGCGYIQFPDKLSQHVGNSYLSRCLFR